MRCGAAGLLPAGRARRGGDRRAGPGLAVEPPSAWLAALLGWWLLALALIDLRAWRLPDVLTLPLIAAGLAAAALGLLPAVDLLHALAGAAVGYLALAGIGWAYRRLRGRDGLGLGDAKLLAAAGAWLGVESLPWLVLIAALLGLALALAARAAAPRRDRGAVRPAAGAGVLGAVPGAGRGLTLSRRRGAPGSGGSASGRSRRPRPAAIVSSTGRSAAVANAHMWHERVPERQ